MARFQSQRKTCNSEKKLEITRILTTVFFKRISNLRISSRRSLGLDDNMSEPDSRRVPGEPEKTQAEIRGFVRRVQDDLYFGPDNVRVVLARMDERLRNTATRMDERLRNTATREDIANMKISVIRWFIGEYPDFRRDNRYSVQMAITINPPSARLSRWLCRNHVTMDQLLVWQDSYKWMIRNENCHLAIQK